MTQNCTSDRVLLVRLNLVTLIGRYKRVTINESLMLIVFVDSFGTCILQGLFLPTELYQKYKFVIVQTTLVGRVGG